MCLKISQFIWIFYMNFHKLKIFLILKHWNVLEIKSYEFIRKEHKPQQDPHHCYISVKHIPCTVSYGQHRALAFLFWNISFFYLCFTFSIFKMILRCCLQITQPPTCQISKSIGKKRISNIHIIVTTIIRTETDCKWFWTILGE